VCRDHCGRIDLATLHTSLSLLFPSFSFLLGSFSVGSSDTRASTRPFELARWGTIAIFIFWVW
jgi:hypothetical protein